MGQPLISQIRDCFLAVKQPGVAVGEEGADETAAPAVGVEVVDHWRKMRFHAEEYPYVWASYILVYSGFGGYLTWRWGWRRLQLTEDRVKVLQGRLKKLVEEEELATARSSGSDGSAVSTQTPPVDDGMELLLHSAGLELGEQLVGNQSREFLTGYVDDGDSGWRRLP